LATQPISDFQDIETTASRSGDSREKLLADLMREADVNLDRMPAAERARALAEIHAIAEGVRKRQEQSAGR